ncbi:MAG TPA: heavy-metal-associated domain-containing protein [Dehalococcoidia bacterium]|jgi:copper chaperone CopZ|nr:heavy-metal-associated domain-containing protein [Dehalococcoidia bacterium]
MRQQTTLEAPDISCDHCIQTIHKAVEALPGVHFISGEPERKQVIVEYDPDETALDLIESVMEVEGYPVKK